jgi:hypothetical protein
MVVIFCSLFYDAFSVTRLYSADDRVTSEWWIDALSGIRTHGLSVQTIKLSPVPRRGHWDRLNDVKNIICVYSDNHKKLINTDFGQNAELLNVKVGGIYSYHWAVKGYAESE